MPFTEYLETCECFEKNMFIFFKNMEAFFKHAHGENDSLGVAFSLARHTKAEQQRMWTARQKSHRYSSRVDGLCQYNLMLHTWPPSY